MPELPEVETTLRGIKPHILKQRITEVVVRHHGLRWPVPKNLHAKLKGKVILQLERRAKYLLLKLEHGTIIIHLGMSGILRVLNHPATPKKHDHIDLLFSNNKILRLTDPRRFGAFLWTEDALTTHSLLKNLGPEPLTKSFSSQYLWQRAQKCKKPVKSFIMDNKIVVGVGNIYAQEALFIAGIDPRKHAGKISENDYRLLGKAIKQVLKKAIKNGGTTLKDFLGSDGKPGYFANHLKVYGREDLPCLQCGNKLKSIRIGQRGTVYCACCQG